MKTIKIKMIDLYLQVTYKEVPCLYYTKRFSVTRTINNDTIPTYTVIHNASGNRVVAFSNFNVAKKFCREANIKWDIDPKNREVIKEFHEWSQKFINSIAINVYYLPQIRG